MANLPQQNTIEQYLTNGVQATFTVPFYTPLEPDLVPDLDVYVTLTGETPNPEADLQIYNTAYIYTPNIDPITGGEITFQPGHIPPASAVITIVRDVSASLDVEFSNVQTFNGQNLDDALDKLLLISQQNKTYALQRNLSYIVNSYLPDAELIANTQLLPLGNMEFWMGSPLGGVINATFEEATGFSTLRSELANNQPVTNGSALVGYYDPINFNPTTVAAQLTYLTGQVISPLPSGTILDFAAATVPTGYLLCDGSAVSRATYSNLFTAIGIVWGAGDGSTTFNLPDLRRRVTMGAGGAASAVIPPGISNTVGATGGEEMHVQSVNEMPSHQHGYTVLEGAGTTVAGGATYNVHGENTGLTGGGNPFNILQPAAIVYKIIKI